MQCPPTNPGLNFIKFHFVEANLKTSLKLNFNLSQAIAISFIKLYLNFWCFLIVLLFLRI